VIRRAVAAALLTLALTAPVRAQDSAEEAKRAAVLEEARQHVAKAKVHYDLGEFKEAAEEYITVYRLRPIPAILFNVAQAYRQAGLYDKARQFYRSYLREAPDAKNKVTIQQSIKEMDDLLAKEKRAREAAPTGVTQPAETSLPIPTRPPAVAQKPPEPAPRAVEKVAEKPVEKPQSLAVAPGKPAVTQPSPTPPAPKPAVATNQPRPPVPVAVTTAPAPQPVAEQDSGSVFTKWWFWTAVGAVAVGGGVAAMSMGGNAAPSSHFGTTPVFP
jgi:tetratricopeptide (TPR) repeat protein